MIPVYSTSAMANHLWQSTVFAGLAGLLAVLLRGNHAGTRYWLWLTASVKFLIPFSALAALGSRLGGLSGWLAMAPVARRPELSIVVEEISRPFPASPAAAASSILARHPGVLPGILLAVWIAGFVAVAFSWWRRWQRIRQAVRGAVPLDLEVAVPVLSSPAMLEPGVFGIFHPVLLLPEGIVDRLTPAHLEAIVAHELCHVRRRDNLAAAVHMAVEAIFWFHPLVWWLGTRLVEERERACDEEVLRLGSHPEIYAESILKTCQFYLESPLECMSGISGSDLEERIVRIMTQRAVHRLSFGRKLLLAIAGMAAVVGPIVFGFVNAPQGRAQPLVAFEVASVKPNHSGTRFLKLNADKDRFVVENATPRLLLQYAYQVNDSQIFGAPGWIDSEHYDIQAGTRKPEGDEQGTRRMLQALLADRFRLALHHEDKDLPIYVLVVDRGGHKLHQSPDTTGGAQMRHNFRLNGNGNLNAVAENLDQFAELLAHQLRRVVVNQTGLTGDYDFTLQWTPDRVLDRLDPASGPPIFAALQEQLGLKLESKTGPVDTLVIDHMEKPSEN